MKNSSLKPPKYEYQLDFVLSDLGDVSDVNVISSTMGKKASINNPDSIIEGFFRMSTDELFIPLLEKIDKDENISKYYTKKNISGNRLLLNKVTENSFKTESIYDTQTGLLLEKNVLQDNLVMDQFVKIQNVNGSVEERKEEADIFSFKRTNLIIENKEPYSCTFQINQEKIDTTFSNTNVTIQGKIIHPNQNREVSIEWYEYLPNSYKTYVVKTKLRDDNTFEVRLNIDDLKKVKFRYQEVIDFYLTPGDDIFITMDMENPEKAEATGVGSNNINYCFKKFVFEKSENLSMHDINNQTRLKYVESTPDEFKKYFFEVEDRKQQFLEDNKKWIDPQCYLAEFWSNKMELIDKLFIYPDYQEIYRQEAGKEPYNINRSDFLDDQFYSLIHPDNDMMAYADDYEHFIREYAFFVLDNKMKDITGNGNIANVNNFYDQLYNSRYGFSGLLYTGYSQYILKYHTVSDALNQASWEVFKNLYNQFLTEYPKTNKARILKEAYAKAEKLAPANLHLILSYLISMGTK